MGKKKDKKVSKGRPNPIRVKKKRKVDFLDPQPPGRYNLAFYAKYNATEEQKTEGNRAFLTFCHQTLPGLLKEGPWNRQKPSSRATCRCDVIREIASISEFFSEIEAFMKRQKTGKFGTITLIGHGSRAHFALPISAGLAQIGIEEMARGLKSIEKAAAGKLEAQGEIDAAQVGALRQLYFTARNIQRDAPKWFDQQTLVRFICCFLGADVPAGRPDPLELFGKTLVGSTRISLDAPKVMTAPVILWWTKASPPAIKVYNTLYRDSKGKNWLHPDMVSEILSDQSFAYLDRDDQQKAKARFADEFLQGPGCPRTADEVRQGRPRPQDWWVPAIGVDPANNPRSSAALVGMGTDADGYNKFRKHWRQVNL